MAATLVNTVRKTIEEQEVAPFLIVFIAYLLTAKLGQYVFFGFDISPALIWPPAAISLAAMLLGGYRMCVPVALAQLLTALTSPSNPSLLVVASSVTAFTLEPLAGAYILRRFGFQNSMNRTRDALLFIGVSLVMPIFFPALVTSAQWATHSLTTTVWITWSRSWAGRVFSLLTLTPFILTWASFRNWYHIFEKKRLAIETVSALSVLALSIYVIFWTALPSVNIFITLYFFFTVLFWIGLRLGPRVTALAILLTTVLGMMGSIVAHPSPTPLNIQLFADELFMVLITPIFLILSALVEERRLTFKKFEDTVTELRHALQKLEIEDISKNEFIATLAHELRNPLAPVMSTFEYLKMSEQKPDTHLMIERAEDQLNIMRRLLDDLLDVARVSQKVFELQQEPMTLQSAIARSIHSVELFMSSRGHTLTVSLPAEPLWVYADPVRLSQIFTNLLYNSAKYTHPGGAIHIEAHEADGRVTASVIDNGIGIAAERIGRIFEPFSHVRPHTTVGTGLGIGLSLTKRLVEMHNGSITAYSEGVGKGSTFSVEIPSHAPPEIEYAQVPSTENFAPLAERSPFSILVVDDNEAAAQGLERLLKLKGHTVAIAYTGEAALNEVGRFHPDVVLLDIGLPDIDGYEVAKQLSQAGVRPFLIALTGYGQDEDKLRAQHAGFNYHLTKPVGILDLESVLYSIIPHTSTPA
jgi:signal transduction histidine kinase/ActR/RegA family two-component response regulator